MGTDGLTEAPAIRIGTSGWSYRHWYPVLYPPGLPAGRQLEAYANEFATVELNGSFYRWPRAESFESWRTRVPAEFVLSVKAPRGLTHAKHLREPQTWMHRISESLEPWHARRPVLLVQLGPRDERDDDRLTTFLVAVPGWLRIAVEFRHPSWHVEPVLDLLERHQASYCVLSGARLPCVLRSTASFVYVRMHGPDDDTLYAGSYSDDDLAWWAERIREWHDCGRDVLVYFNNDGDGNAVRNARTLRDQCR